MRAEATWQRRWDDAWRAVGGTGGADGALEALLARYREPQRHYHTVRHLEESFARYEQVRERCAHPGEVAIALLFHDAVYDPRAGDNEARSADLAVAEMGRRGTAPDAAERVRDLILATRHVGPPPTEDAALLVDIDLGILAADAARFDEYEQDIRREYVWVPGILFRRKRRGILQGFLDRDRVFVSGAFDADEAAARRNLLRAIDRL